MAGFAPDAIPDVAEVREGLSTRFEKHRVAILGAFALVVGGSLALLAMGSVRRDREDRIRAEYHSIVDDYEGDRTLFTPGGDPAPRKDVAKEQAGRLEALRARAKGAEVEPLLLLQLALRWQVAGEDAKAVAVLEELDAGFRDSPVLQIPSFDTDRASLVARLKAQSEARGKFAADLKFVEPKADLSVHALVETDLGAMKIVLFRDVAPKHAEAFLARAKAGAFNGTQAYVVHRGAWIECGGGDRTRNDDPRDDREDDPALALAPEDDARYLVKHRRRTVTSVPLLSGDQADRFAVVIAEARPEFDGVRTPFGQLLDDASASVADRIGSVMTYSQDAKKIGKKEERDFPYTPSSPVRIRRVSVWKEGALDAGHAWDTSRVNTDQPEPGKEETKPEEKTEGGK